MESREQTLRNLSSLVINGVPTYKLDLIAVISIHGRPYFNVFRRYNSVYEFVIEDFNGDLFMHKDYTIRQSIQHLLYLLPGQMDNMRAEDIYSFKHSAAPPTHAYRINDMRWSEIQRDWFGVAVNFTGILDEYYIYNQYQATSQNMFRSIVEERASQSLPLQEDLTRHWSEREETDSDEDTDADPSDYTLLRNGTKVFRK